MSKGLEALKTFRELTIRDGYTTFDSIFHPIGESKIYSEAYDIIEKELIDKEELEKAFVALSKDDEKAKKLLSKEIEKNRAFEIIKEFFEFDFALRFPNNQPMIMITNKHGGSYFEIPISKDKYDLLKEVLL